MPKKTKKAKKSRGKPKARGGRPISKTCMAPDCDNPASTGEGTDYRRYARKVGRRGKVTHLHVCRGCWDRWYANGSFERKRPVTWDEDDERQAIQMRRAGSSATEIREAFPNVPRRTLYDMFARAGLTSGARRR